MCVEAPVLRRFCQATAGELLMRAMMYDVEALMSVPCIVLWCMIHRMNSCGVVVVMTLSFESVGLRLYRSVGGLPTEYFWRW